MHSTAFHLSQCTLCHSVVLLLHAKRGFYACYLSGRVTTKNRLLPLNTVFSFLSERKALVQGRNKKREANGGTGLGAQALKAHQHTLFSHLKTRF